MYGKVWPRTWDSSTWPQDHLSGVATKREKPSLRTYLISGNSPQAQKANSTAWIVSRVYLNKRTHSNKLEGIDHRDYIRDRKVGLYQHDNFYFVCAVYCSFNSLRWFSEMFPYFVSTLASCYESG